MLGFKIVPDKKSDKEDLEIFKKSICELKRLCISFMEIPKREEPIHPNEIAELVEELYVNSLLYNDNKFSLPLAIFNISQSVVNISNVVSNYVSIIQDVMLNHNEDNVRYMAFKMSEVISQIILNAKNILSAISYDEHRYKMGVDVIRDYYERRNIRFFKHKCDDKMTIRFLKPSLINNKIKGVKKR